MTRRARTNLGLSLFSLTLLLCCALPTLALAQPEPAAVFGSWTNVTTNLAGQPSECGNLTLVQPVPNSGTVLAGVAASGLWSSSNDGESWSHAGMGPGSASIMSRPSWITFDPLNPAIFWLSGIYGVNGAGIYKTVDGGNTFHPLGTIVHNDFVSVDFTDPLRQTLLAGSHEGTQKVYKSADGGNTWTNIGLNLPSGSGFSTNPLIINSSTYLVNTYSSFGVGSPGMYRTTNGGAAWTKVSSEPANAAPLVTTSGTILYSAGNGVVSSADNGLTWARIGTDLQFGVHPIQIPDGRLVHISRGNLVVSADGGSSWTPLGPPLPYTPAGVAFSPASSAFFIWRWDCGARVLPNAIQRLSVSFGAPPPTPTPMPSPTSTPVPAPTAEPPPPPAMDSPDATPDGSTDPPPAMVDNSDPGQDSTPP